MLVPHPFDIVVILLGIFLALRKSEVRSEDPARHPRVALADFDDWRRRALAAYSIGTFTCFLRVLVDFAFAAFLQRHPLELIWSRTIGFSIEIVTVVALVTCAVFARRARRLADRLGIDLSAGTARVDALPKKPASDVRDGA